MKYFIYFVLLIASHTAHAERIEYNSSFLGLQVGQSRLGDVMDLLGEPKEVRKIKNNAKYIYDGFDFNFTDEVSPIKSIVIYDSTYVDINNISVGASRAELRKLFNQPISGSYFVDKKNGIIYWFQGNRVSHIALAAEMYF